LCKARRRPGRLPPAQGDARGDEEWARFCPSSGARGAVAQGETPSHRRRRAAALPEAAGGKRRAAAAAALASRRKKRRQKEKAAGQAESNSCVARRPRI